MIYLLEFLIFFHALPAGLYVRFDFRAEQFPETASTLWITATLYAALLSGALTAVGMYQRGLTFSAGFVLRLGLSFLMASMGLSLMFFAFPELILGRGVVAYAMLFSFIGILATRSLWPLSKG